MSEFQKFNHRMDRVKDRVRHYLELNPQARNQKHKLYGDMASDIVWGWPKYDKVREIIESGGMDKGIFNGFLCNLFNDMQLESVRREMQHIQNEEKVLGPTDPTIIERREAAQEAYYQRAINKRGGGGEGGYGKKVGEEKRGP